jgi:hypothetical protein
MPKWILAAGAAALALSLPTIATAQGGQGKGQGQGQQKGQGQGQAKAERGGGERGQGAGQQRQSVKPERAERGPGPKADRAPDHARGSSDVRSARSVEPAKAKGPGPKPARVALDTDRGDVLIRRSFIDGGPFFRRGNQPFDCPPGLDRKDNGCLPPGQVTKLLGAPLAAAFADDLVPLAYRNWYRDDDDFLYRSGDGFIYRVDRSNGLVDGLIPLFGNGYYTMGDPWPQPYNFYNVPYQYRSLWSDSDDAYYRFGDGAIYQVDPATNVVRSIVALLAGDLGVGSRLPLGYDTYNVPLAYRDRYYDTADNWYRYNDGYIYRVDPTTRLITAVIDAII